MTEQPATLPSLLASVVAARGAHDAVAMPHETLSYDELDRRTARLARALLALGAGKNLSDKPRWAYIVLIQPEDARWNGAPPEAFDTTGLTMNEPFPDDRFPVLSLEAED